MTGRSARRPPMMVIVIGSVVARMEAASSSDSAATASLARISVSAASCDRSSPATSPSDSLLPNICASWADDLALALAQQAPEQLPAGPLSSAPPGTRLPSACMAPGSRPRASGAIRLAARRRP
jgi:hypothetical protein